jgi:hypothetical protein
MAWATAHTILHSAAPGHAIGRRSLCEPDARAVTNLGTRRFDIALIWISSSVSGPSVVTTFTTLPKRCARFERRWPAGRRVSAVLLCSRATGDAEDARSAAEREQVLRGLESNRREDVPIISEWVEQEMNSEWHEHHTAMEPPPASE